MDYQKDSWIVSVFWGRLGAAILALVSFVLGILGYTFSKEAQESAFGLIMAILSGVGGLLAVISKIREKKKTQ
uniref:Uncharacterized protein n=1 Tax=viral metagenome TaxID=1070528 RepID=A0A6H2A5H9_9ZZZZ